MKSEARVVVIGGGVVGASVLYHLTKAGWTDVVLVERTELTAGSTWHAAGGMHTINGDPNVAKLQRYTTELYAEIERVSGQDCGIHKPGGVLLADTPERLDWLRMAHARGRYLGMDTEMISVAEAAEMVPLFDPEHFVGAMLEAHEGHVDPAGVTHAFAKAARMAGAEVYRGTWARAVERRGDGSWRVRLPGPDRWSTTPRNLSRTRDKHGHTIDDPVVAVAAGRSDQAFSVVKRAGTKTVQRGRTLSRSLL